MRVALDEFDRAIQLVREQTPIYDHLVNDIHLPSAYSSEILRSQLVCAVSAMDRFFHEVVRIGFIEAFKGIRKKTSTFNSWHFPNDLMLSVIRLSDSSFIPSSVQETPEYVIEQNVVRQLSFVAYQNPDKIKEALGYIWIEDHKLQVIACSMGFAGTEPQKQLEQKIKLICERRHQIVHEGDIEPVSRSRRAIVKRDVADSIAFIELLCHTVFSLITNPSCYTSLPTTP